MAMKAIRQLEMVAYKRTDPRRRLRKTTMEILTKAMDGAQNFCIIQDPFASQLHAVVNGLKGGSGETYKLNAIPLIMRQVFERYTNTIEGSYIGQFDSGTR
jgi:hypothetical protein